MNLHIDKTRDFNQAVSLLNLGSDRATSLSIKDLHSKQPFQAINTQKNTNWRGNDEKINKKAFKPIDQEEKDLMESIERGEWEPVKKFDQEKEKAVSAARNTLSNTYFQSCT